MNGLYNAAARCDLQNLFFERENLIVETSNRNSQVGNYIQPLWETIQPVGQGHADVDIYNGAVEAGTTLTSKKIEPIPILSFREVNRY